MLARSSLRYMRRHPWLAGLSILGVALGVAVVVAVDLANVSATRAFELSGESLTGRATHQVVAGPGGVPDTLYRRLRVKEGLTGIAPVVQGTARADSDSARVFQVLGVDLFAEGEVRPYIGPGTGVDLRAFLTTPGAALLSAETAADVGVQEGDTLTLRISGRAEAATVMGVLEPTDDRSRSALRNLLVVDIATAQDWMNGDGGALTRIDVVVPEGAAGEQRLDWVRSVLPESVRLRPASQQTEVLATMTQAFRTNLFALSLLALVVGVFLIYNTITFSVVRRRRLLGTYRALGVTRREVFTLVLVEAVGVGIVGTALGIALGVVMGGGLVQLVTQTINDLYFVMRVREPAPAPESLLKGLAVGLGATVVVAARPAWEAAASPPATALRRSTQEAPLEESARRLALMGLLAVLLGVLVLTLPGGVAPAYVGLLFLIAGAALAAPWATRSFAAAARPVSGALMGPVGRMAARGITASLSRTAVAVTALAVAVAATVGVGVMVSSFRTTVETWLMTTLQADVYISPPSDVLRRGGGTLDPGLAQDLTRIEGVGTADSVRARTIETERGQIDLFATTLDRQRAQIYRFKSGNRDEAIERAVSGDVLISEPLSFRFDLGVGDSLQLPTDAGPRPFRVAGVYYDYGSDLGVVLMDRSVYSRAFDDAAVSGIALYAAEGTDPETLVARARSLAEGRQQLQVRSNRSLRETSLALFDRTFLVTNVLRLLAVLVAFVGVLSALMALQLERSRELAMLRAQGLTPAELRRMVFVQTGLMGLWAGVLALPLGLALAAVLVFVINQRSFGWTLAFEVDPLILLQAVGLALAAALLAGVYPAWRMSTADPVHALREDA